MVYVAAFLLFISMMINVALFLKAYSYEGDIVVTQKNGKKLFSLDFESNPDKIETMKVVRFRVVGQVSTTSAE